MKVKTKRTICRIMGLTLLLAMLGIVRGMDMGIMPVGKGAALSALCELTAVCAWWKGGVFRHG